MHPHIARTHKKNMFLKYYITQKKNMFLKYFTLYLFDFFHISWKLKLCISQWWLYFCYFEINKLFNILVVKGEKVQFFLSSLYFHHYFVMFQMLLKKLLHLAVYFRGVQYVWFIEFESLRRRADDCLLKVFSENESLMTS